MTAPSARPAALFDFGTLAASPGLSPTIDISGLGFAPSGSLTVTQSGNKIVLNGISAVPEPGSLVLLALSGLGLGARRRKTA